MIDLLKVMQNAPQDAKLGDTVALSVVVNQCQSCERRNPDRSLRCEAFPDSIPALIFMGLYDHTNPYDMDGQDDHGLTWIPEED